jgi:hypothetical protein
MLLLASARRMLQAVCELDVAPERAVAMSEVTDEVVPLDQEWPANCHAQPVRPECTVL